MDKKHIIHSLIEALNVRLHSAIFPTCKLTHTQRAFDKRLLVAGCIIYLGEGSFRVRHPIPPNTKIIGQGVNTELKFPHMTNTDA